MKTNILSLFMALFVSVVLIAGCNTKPILNIQDRPIVAGGVTGELDLGQVQEAIMRAGKSLGWNMKPKGPNRIIGTFLRQDHMAKVAISYDTTSYSISYLDSANLKYSGGSGDDEENGGGGGTIHRAYNNWVKTLQQTIDAQLANLDSW